MGLLTVTNEKGEIRVCDLVPTKAHSMFELALRLMSQSLQQYGHLQPALFYTDNMADKQFLEAAFPSLLQDVVPVEKYAHLEPLVIPTHIQILVRDTAASIDRMALTLLDALGAEDEGSTLAVCHDLGSGRDLGQASAAHATVL